MELLAILLIAAATGSGLVAGLLFGFSIAVMPALARQPAEHGLRVMQTINAVILNPLFLSVFMGTAVVAVVIGGFVLLPGGRLAGGWALAGSLLYLTGAFGVTAIVNVPLNNTLAGVEPGTDRAAGVWRSYLARWTWWNHVRTAAAAAAAIAWMVALARPL